MSFPSIGSIQRLSSHLQKQEGRMSQALKNLSGTRTSQFSVNRALADSLQIQAHGIAQGANNASLNSARLSTASTHLDKGSEILGSMRELATRASDDSLSKSDRAALQEEFKQLHSEVSQTLGKAQFNGRQILKGEGVSLQTDQSQSYQDADGGAILDELKGIDLSTAQGAKSALDKLDQADHSAKVQQGSLNAAQSGMERATKRAMSHATNLEEAAWAIGDNNLAQGIAEFVAAASAHSATLAVLSAHNSQILSETSFLMNR